MNFEIMKYIILLCLVSFFVNCKKDANDDRKTTQEKPIIEPMPFQSTDTLSTDTTYPDESLIYHGTAKIRNIFDLRTYADEFGDTNITKDSIYLGEGEYVDGFSVFKDSAGSEIGFIVDSTDKSKIREIRISAGNGSKWRIVHDISIDTSLRYLQKINNAVIGIAGFDWDYGGTIISYNGGELGKIKGITLRLGPSVPDSVAQKYPTECSGDRGLKSTDECMVELDPKIYQIILRNPG